MALPWAGLDCPLRYARQVSPFSWPKGPKFNSPARRAGYRRQTKRRPERSQSAHRSPSGSLAFVRRPRPCEPGYGIFSPLVLSPTLPCRTCPSCLRVRASDYSEQAKSSREVARRAALCRVRRRDSSVISRIASLRPSGTVSNLTASTSMTSSCNVSNRPWLRP